MTRLLFDKTLCAACIGRNAAIKVSFVYDALRRIRRYVTTWMLVDRCDDCQQETIVHRIG